MPGSAAAPQVLSIEGSADMQAFAFDNNDPPYTEIIPLRHPMVSIRE
jgi:hypothetical protein